MTIGLAIPPLTVKNRGGGALILDCALNWANRVSGVPFMPGDLLDQLHLNFSNF